MKKTIRATSYVNPEYLAVYKLQDIFMTFT